jgi:hypothetical protein
MERFSWEQRGSLARVLQYDCAQPGVSRFSAKIEVQTRHGIGCRRLEIDHIRKPTGTKPDGAVESVDLKSSAILHHVQLHGARGIGHGRKSQHVNVALPHRETSLPAWR